LERELHRTLANRFGRGFEQALEFHHRPIGKPEMPAQNPLHHHPLVRLTERLEVIPHTPLVSGPLAYVVLLCPWRDLSPIATCKASDSIKVSLRFFAMVKLAV